MPTYKAPVDDALFLLGEADRTHRAKVDEARKLKIPVIGIVSAMRMHEWASASAIVGSGGVSSSRTRIL